MKKKIAKLLALGMSIALVFSLAACNDNTEPDESESQSESQSVAVDVTDDSAVPASEDASASAASESSDEGSSASNDTPSTGGITSPGSDVNAAVTLYNNAIGQAGFTTANVQRSWGGSQVTIVGDLADLDDRVVSMFEEPATESVTPGAISAGDIASVSSTDNGSTITMNFTLKDASLGENAAIGDASYPYFITFDSGNALVQNIANTITGGSLSIELRKEGTTISLSGGSISATVDKASGKMTALSCQVSEQIDSRAKASGLPGSLSAMVKGSASVSFS